jgi:predicted dehydrogenase
LSDRTPAPLAIGLIGFGNHVAKNLVRLFDRPAGPIVRAVHVRDPARYAAVWPAFASRFTGALANVLNDPQVEAVYIASPLSTHHTYARAALEAGKHVLCEKPLTWHLDEAEELAGLSASRGLLLGEIAAYRHHRQFDHVRGLLGPDARLLAIRARFTIPALPADNIRYRSDLGGGALRDVGYYPISAAGELLGTPDAVCAVGAVCPDRGVDLYGQALLGFGSVGCHCTWAIGASYCNELELSFEHRDVLVSRAFSKPADLATAIAVREDGGEWRQDSIIPADDQFANLFAAFTRIVRQDDRAAMSALTEASLRDARTMARVAQAMDR